MHKIIKKTYELIDTLEESKLIQKLDIAKQKIIINDKLMTLINKAKFSQTEEEIRKIRQELLFNKDYQQYMKSYNELFFIILKINKKYNSYFNTRSCLK